MTDLVPDGHKLGWLLNDEDESWFDSLPEGTPFKSGVDFDAPPAERIYPSDWIRIENQNGFGSCFPAGAKVTMADGSIKKIEDIRFGDRVLTHNRRSRPVTDTMSRSYTGDMVTVFVKGWGKIRMTADHVVRVLRNGSELWLRADEIVDTDMLLVSRGVTDNPNHSVDVANYISLPLLYEDEGGVIYANGGKGVNRHLMLNENSCWVLGLYAAEGSTGFSSAGVADRSTWTIHADEVDECLPKIEEFAKSLGLTVRVSVKMNSKAANVIIDSAIVGEFLKTVCGRFANKKKVPEFILRGSQEQKIAFLRGYFFGDGSDKKLKEGRIAASGNKVKCLQVHAATASRVLSQQVSTMLVSLGAKPGRTLTRTRSHQNHPSYQTYLYSRDACWLAGTEWESGRSARSLVESDSGQARPIREITREHVSALTVFDFTVADDHSFVCQGLVVHNCQGHALSSVMEVAYWIASRGQVTQLSRWMAYVGTQRIDGIRGDQGSTISGGAKLAETYGVCPEEVYPYPRRYTQSISESQYESAKPYRLRSFRTMRSVEDVRNWLDAGLGGISIGVRWGSGGHAIAILEVLKDGSGVNVANSWGTSWGQRGWFTWTWRELEGKLRESYTRAIGMSDMAEIAPREWDFSAPGQGVMG